MTSDPLRTAIAEVVREVVREELRAVATSWVLVPLTGRQCRDAARRGELTISRVGRAYYAPREAFEAYMRAHAIAAPVRAADDSAERATLAADRAIFLGVRGR